MSNLSARQMAIEAHQNVAKSVLGVRPNWIAYNEMTVEEIEADTRFYAQQEEEERKGYCEESIKAMLAHGAGDFPTARRWALQA